MSELSSKDILEGFKLFLLNFKISFELYSGMWMHRVQLQTAMKITS